MEENQINNDTQQEDVKVEETEIPKNKFEVESYSPSSLNFVNKMRVRGKMYKVDVPYLSHHLTKPEKTRVKYVVFAVMLFVLAAAVAVLPVLLALSSLPSLFGAAGDVGSSSPSWDVMNFVSGLSGMAIGLALLIIFMLIAGLVAICAYLIYNGKCCLNLSKATKEEMAHGVIISKFMWSLIATFAIAIGVLIFFMFLYKDIVKYLCTPIPYLLLVMAIAALVMFIFVIRDRIQNSQYVKTLDQETQNDIMAHFGAMKQVKRRKEIYDNRNRMFWR